MVRMRPGSDLHMRLKREARRHGLTINSEIITRLEASFVATDIKTAVREALEECDAFRTQCGGQHPRANGARDQAALAQADRGDRVVGGGQVTSEASAREAGLDPRQTQFAWHVSEPFDG